MRHESAGTGRRTRRWGRIVALLSFAAIVMFTVPYGATEADEGSVDNERSQKRGKLIRSKLQTLEGDMKSLIEELQRGGYEYEAKLLARGLEHLANSDLKAGLSRLLSHLQAAQSNEARKAAEAVLLRLEELLAILEDRDREFNRKQIEATPGSEPRMLPSSQSSSRIKSRRSPTSSRRWPTRTAPRPP